MPPKAMRRGVQYGVSQKGLSTKQAEASMCANVAELRTHSELSFIAITLIEIGLTTLQRI